MKKKEQEHEKELEKHYGLLLDSIHYRIDILADNLHQKNLPKALADEYQEKLSYLVKLTKMLH